MKKIKKILIANRGEIASRIISTCKKLDIQTFVVYSEADRDKPFVKQADLAFFLGKSEASESYLNISKILEACKTFEVDAVHPGYGFLSENSEFAKAVESLGIIFIGPSPKAILAMGDKVESRKLMLKANVPVIPGYEGEDQSPNRLLEEAMKIGFPVMIKASAGGGGKGMRRVDSPKDFLENLESAKREARNFFANDKVFLEKFIASARHIEVQVFGDKYGNYVHFYERDCSVQRRNQKVIEESPAINLSTELKSSLYKTAILAASSIEYTNAGTVEFIVSDTQEFFFLEMNTRLQVEHPVTEMITGIDLVELQIQIAEGKKLPFTNESLSFPQIKGHSIELRIYAEDMGIPSSGILREFYIPSELGIRIDSGVERGCEITTHYDSMIAKLIVHADSRDECIQKLTQTIQRSCILGLPTNLTYLKKLINHPNFRKGGVNTKFIEENITINYLQDNINSLEIVGIAHIVSGLRKVKTFLQEWKDFSIWKEISTEISFPDVLDPLHKEGMYHFKGKDYLVQTLDFDKTSVLCQIQEYSKLSSLNTIVLNLPYPLAVPLEREKEGVWSYEKYGKKIYLSFLGQSYIVECISRSLRATSHSKGAFHSPMPGKIISIFVKEKDKVKAGTALLIVEAMKMENVIYAPEDLIVEKIYFKVGEQVNPEQQLLEVRPWQDA